MANLLPSAYLQSQRKEGIEKRTKLEIPPNPRQSKEAKKGPLNRLDH